MQCDDDSLVSHRLDFYMLKQKPSQNISGIEIEARSNEV